MFEANDLSLAYGSYEQESNEVDFSHQQHQQQQNQQNHQQQQQFQQAPPPPQKQQLPPLQPPPLPPPSIQPNISYSQQEPTYASAYARPQQQMKQPIYYTQNVSIVDKFFSKWYDVLKVISFALIIVLAISIDRFFTFYLTQYVADSILSTAQEVLVRISYPIIIIIIIWFMKIM